eukprot:6679549-Pyramimonas_sp.AAC.1
METRSALKQSNSAARERVANASSAHAMGGLMGARSPPLSWSIACVSLGSGAPGRRAETLPLSLALQ